MSSIPREPKAAYRGFPSHIAYRAVEKKLGDPSYGQWRIFRDKAAPKVLPHDFYYGWLRTPESRYNALSRFVIASPHAAGQNHGAPIGVGMSSPFGLPTVVPVHSYMAEVRATLTRLKEDLAGAVQKHGWKNVLSFGFVGAGVIVGTGVGTAGFAAIAMIVALGVCLPAAVILRAWYTKSTLVERECLRAEEDKHAPFMAAVDELLAAQTLWHNYKTTNKLVKHGGPSMGYHALDAKPVTPGAQADCNADGGIGLHITSTMSPKQFDELISQAPGYRLKQGGRCSWHALAIAVNLGNFALVEHIANNGDPNLVNLAVDSNRTPLSLARNSEHMSAGDKSRMVELLKSLGAITT